MRGAGITTAGGAIEPVEVEPPGPPGDDEVLIAVRAAGVGYWDELVRIGRWDIGVLPPATLGVEGAGVVVAIGEGVRGLVLGAAVMTHPLPRRGHGTWGERLLAPAASVAPVPNGISWEVAAAFPIPALTAVQALDDVVAGDVGDWLLVNGAGGVTGTLLAQLAVARGARVIVTASPTSAARLARIGAEYVLDRTDPGWPDIVRRISGRRAGGVTAAVNATRGGAATTLAAVADGGRMATITGDPPPSQRGVIVSDVYVRPDGRRLADLGRLLAAGRLDIRVATTRPFTAAGSALAEVVSGRSGGATVLRPPVG